MAKQGAMLVDELRKTSRYGRDDLIDIRRQGEYASGRALRISFQRTIRVSDNGSTNNLPPSFGAFPLYETSDYQASAALPAEMKAKGGYLMPMHQREAMWIRFESKDKFAVKIYIGGVNAVSGEPALETEETKARRYKLLSEKKTIQDYIVTPDQMWLDGVASIDGAVRQFVAVPLHSGYTVEAQITGGDMIGGLQLEIVPVKEKCSIVARPPSLEQINAAVAAKSQKTTRFHVLVKTNTGRNILVYASPSGTIHKIKESVEDQIGMPAPQQRLILRGKQVSDDRTLQDYDIVNRGTLHLVEGLRGGGGPIEPAMGIATGGMIKQSILRDNNDPNVWDPESGLILNVQILNSAVFEAVTGEPSPKTPVSVNAYAKYGYTYYDIWNEKPSGIKGDFSGVKSVAEKDLEGTPTLEKVLAVAEVSEVNQGPVVLLDKTGGCVGFRPVQVMEKELVEKFRKLDFSSKPGSKRKSGGED